MSRPPPKAATKPAPPKGKRDPANTHFGEAVKAAREAKGLSQRELSRVVGIPQPHIPGIERGVRDIRLSTAARIARALGVPLKDMLPEKP